MHTVRNKSANVVIAAVLALMVAAASGCAKKAAGPGTEAAAPLHVVVMDPLAGPLSCDCLKGYAQRRYDRLGEFLQRRLNRQVVVSYCEYLEPGHVAGGSGESAAAGRGERAELPAAVVIGQQSLAMADAKALKVALRPLARLTDAEGETTVRGVFLVRVKDGPADVAGMGGLRLLLGSAEHEECSGLALAAMAAAKVPPPVDARTEPAYVTRALAVVDKTADVTVVPAWSMRKLFDTGKIERAWLKQAGVTDPAPFITAFAAPAADAATAEAVKAALMEVRADGELLKALESRDGFVSVEEK